MNFYLELLGLNMALVGIAILMIWACVRLDSWIQKVSGIRTFIIQNVHYETLGVISGSLTTAEFLEKWDKTPLERRSFCAENGLKYDPSEVLRLKRGAFNE